MEIQSHGATKGVSELGKRGEDNQLHRDRDVEYEHPVAPGRRTRQIEGDFQAETADSGKPEQNQKGPIRNR